MVNLWRIDCVLKERKSIDLCMGNCLTNFSIEVHFHKSNKCFFVCCKSFGWLKFNIHCWASFIKQTIQWTMCVCVFWKIKTLPYHFSCYFHLSSCWLQFFGVFLKLYQKSNIMFVELICYSTTFNTIDILINSSECVIAFLGFSFYWQLHNINLINWLFGCKVFAYLTYIFVCCCVY